MKTCRFQSFLSPYLDGELDPALTEKVRCHMESCEFCKNAYAELAETDEILKSIPDITVSSGFDSAFFEKMSGIEQAGSGFSFFRIGWKKPAMAMLCLLFTGVLSFYPREDPGLSPDEMIIAGQMELLMDFDLVRNLDLLENWEDILQTESTESESG